MASSAKKKPALSSSMQSGSRGKMPPSAPPPFVKAFFANMLADDLALFAKAERDLMAASIWQLAAQRKAGKPNFRVYNPSEEMNGWTVDHTVLEIVNDDMPFLVDSVTGALQRRGLTVHLVIHPVIYVRRAKDGSLQDMLPHAAEGTGAESFMHVQFDNCLDKAVLTEIEADIRAVLTDVRAAVQDWPEMRECMTEAMALVRKAPAAMGKRVIEEGEEFLRWLDNNNFTYLGYRDVDLVLKDGKLDVIKVKSNSGLGILRDNDIRLFGGLRDLDPKKTPTLQAYVRHQEVLVVAKTNPVSRVHRQVPMDAIFIRRFDEQGRVIGERLFVGLFTSQSYSQNPREIPFLRRKIDVVEERAGFRRDSHDHKVLMHILNNYPHDELFQITDEELYDNALGILQLQERARVALFTRRDPFGRFVTCLIYVPRDRYDSALRLRIQDVLERTFGGKAENWFVRIDDSRLARAFVTMQLTPSSPKNINIPALEDELRAMCRAWPDRLRDVLSSVHGEAQALALLRRYGEAFPATYREAVLPQFAVHDIARLEKARDHEAGGITVDLSPSEGGMRLDLKLFRKERVIALSEVLPMIENMGLKVDYMGGPYEVKPKGDSASIFIHEFVGPCSEGLAKNIGHIKPAFEEAVEKIWQGEVENDSFNALTLYTGMPWREVMLLRTFARYLRQLRIPYSQEAIAQTFVNHPSMARNIVALFNARHNPDIKIGRDALYKRIEGELIDSLGKVKVLEEDRILRRAINLVQASLRTNYFQLTKDGGPKNYLSIKFDSRAVDFMPLPKPLYEIFVYSVRTEAVHLRGGKVARGGIRWSDRREDFRNEILGLMKAQMVKNTVIIPVGSKGGFVVKHPPAEADKQYAEGVECYRIMIRGLLDITDNRVGSKIVAPERIVRHDADDPYLVVAADKGTAKFSDIANALSQEYGFWLDDAFASGGSAGYDHKDMGITARGAWEAIKRHFREMGKDIQTTDFTCIGVGDMSGDVFGNGMLLSKHTRLLGAFDHRHIFCDPNPDAAQSHAERQRLFDLPRSSWADYDSKKISKGGGVFSRSEKLVKISAEMKKAYGITADSLPPNELIQAMLKAEVELLYFGGIGTYIKSSDETHDQVSDRATEALRIDGSEVRAKVVGEGANLGVTQKGRIEYALKGGRINTDAIDNSAGVDTSDHEVNIKILLRAIVDRKALSLEARNKLLASMTDDVAKLVLRDNYLQTQALSLSEAHAAESLSSYVRMMHLLEKEGLLNRAIEFLPDGGAIAERKRAGKGLTRPELAVLMAYAKIWLYDRLLESSLPDDPALRGELAHYFPEALQKKYIDDISKHRLAREIIATATTNSIVNRAGTRFMLSMIDGTGKDIVAVTRAYIVAREVLDMRPLCAEIEVLDNRVPAKVQTDMLLAVRTAISQAVSWLLTEIDLPSSLTPVIATYSKGIQQIDAWHREHAADIDPAVKAQIITWVDAGVPHALAQRVALLSALLPAFDLTLMSKEAACDFDAAAAVYFAVGQRLALDWFAQNVHISAVQTPWMREAILSAMADLTFAQRRIVGDIIGGKSKKPQKPADKLKQWLDRHEALLERYDTQLAEWRNSGANVDLAMLNLAARRLAEV